MAGSDLIGGFEVGFNAMQTMVEATRRIVQDRRWREGNSTFAEGTKKGEEANALAEEQETAEIKSKFMARREAGGMSAGELIELEIEEWKAVGGVISKYGDANMKLGAEEMARYPGNPYVEKSAGRYFDNTTTSVQGKIKAHGDTARSIIAHRADQLDALQTNRHARIQTGQIAEGETGFKAQEEEKQIILRTKAMQAVLGTMAKAKQLDPIMQAVIKRLGGKSEDGSPGMDQEDIQQIEDAGFDAAEAAQQAEVLVRYWTTGEVPEGIDVRTLPERPEEVEAPAPAAQRGAAPAPSKLGSQQAAAGARGETLKNVGRAVAAVPGQIDEAFSAGMAEKGTQIRNAGGWLQSYVLGGIDSMRNDGVNAAKETYSRGAE